MFRSLQGLGPKTLGALLLGSALVFLAVSQAAAGGPRLSLDRITVAEDEQVTMDLQALDVGGLGLGAWEIQVHYDAGVVEPVVCSSNPNGYCNHGPNGLTCPIGVANLPAQTDIVPPA
jgi:hypothetical protein